MDWDTIEERTINLKNSQEVEAVRSFLAKFDLTYEETVDYTVTYIKDDRIVATGSLAGEVLRNIAVANELQGEGLTSRVVTRLMQEAARQGHYHYFIYTKPNAVPQFKDLGFSEVGRADPYTVLLEAGMGSIDSYLNQLAKQAITLPEGPRAGLVVNCNPFTYGHKKIIAAAAAENKSVIVLVVSEDRSLFPFEIRLRLIREGLQEFDNVAVLAGGKYVVSAATFPGYFTKGKDTELAQTRLDAFIYATRIAPRLGISTRYVGEEPYCQVTAAYNRALQDILPVHGITVKVMDRLQIEGETVSASTVREKIRQSDWAAVRKLVPDSTYNYLMSEDARGIIAKIQQSDSRH